MKISKQQLIEMGACQLGLDRFIEQTGNTDEPVDVLSLLGGKNTASDLIWLAGETLPIESLVRFTCDVALINIEKIEPYTDKYNLIVDFLENPATTVAGYAAVNAADAAIGAVTHIDYAAVEAVYTATVIATAVADNVIVNAADVAADAAATVVADNVIVNAANAAATDVVAETSSKQIKQLIVKMFEG